MGYKKKLHIIMPGGGVKGCFQAGFLYYLLKFHSDKLELSRVDGTSVGALNGYCICSNSNIDVLKNVWFSINTIDDIFTLHSKLPILKNIMQGYCTLQNNGIFSSEKLKNIIDSNGIKNFHLLKNFNCTAVNVENGKCEYINGTDPKINEYVLASSSPWIITQPVKVNNTIYCDGGLVDTYPIKYFKPKEFDYVIILGYDKNHHNMMVNRGDCNSILNYLNGIIDVCRSYSVNMRKVKQYKKLNINNVIFIDNPIHCGLIEFDKKIIKEGFFCGIIAAIKFVHKYL